MSSWAESISKAVFEGKTNSQFAIPDGKWLGDLFFITDSKNRIIHAFSWCPPQGWLPECTVFEIQEKT